VVSAEAAAIGWLETRLPDEMHALAEGCAVAHDFLHRALSPEVIIPGTTTTKDVEWWLRNRVHAAGFGTWFHPSCTVQRAGDGAHRELRLQARGHGDRPRRPGAHRLRHRPRGPVHRSAAARLRAAARRVGATEGADRRPRCCQPPSGPAHGRVRDGTHRQRRPGGDPRRGGGRGHRRRHLHPPDRHPRPRRRAHHRPVGPPGADPRGRRVPGVSEHRVLDRTPGPGEGPRVDDQTVQFMLEEDAFFDGESCSFVDGRQTELWVL
jgi:hypothetical protein